MQKLTYTVKEVSEILNIGLSKTYELLRQNIIPNIKVGKRIIIPIEALNRWLNTQTAGAHL